jgi:hypothetical protein
MKKILVLMLTIFAVIFASCDLFDDEDHSDVIGKWTGSYGNNGTITLDISSGTWVLLFEDSSIDSFNGSWTREGNTLTLGHSGTASLAAGSLILEQYVTSGNQRPRTSTLTKASTGGTSNTRLTIKNESGFELTHVLWNNVSFANNQTENSIKPGTSVTMDVQAGNGFIRFRPKLNPFNTRTEQIFVVETGKHGEFVFISNTVVVREGITVSSGTLASFASNVFDGKIGETGPGGGIIFFADGGQFKECSGELGIYTWDDARTRAGNHNGGGFNDWQLPDRGDLDLMYRNLHMLGLGGFLNALYWSSTRDGINAWLQNFSSTSVSYIDDAWVSPRNLSPGAQASASTSRNSCRVRAVRSFSIF